MMKKLICLLTAALLSVMLFGCGEAAEVPVFTESASPTEQTLPRSPEETEPQTGETEPQTEETVPQRPVEEPVEDGAAVPGDPVGGHTHRWTAEVVAPGCTTEGYAAHVCPCGVTVVDSYIDATGHSFGAWIIVTEPTQDRTGEAERTCSGCGEKETRALDALPAGHTHSYAQTVTVEATCAAVGEMTYRCACGDAYTDEIPKPDHSFAVETVAPTCTQMGHDLHTCTACGYSYRDSYTECLPHDDELTETPATCTTGSYITFTCRVCGDTVIGHRGPSLGGHEWGKWVETEPATEGSAGTRERACTVCGEKQTETVSKPEHTHSYKDTVVEATCTEEGYTLHTCGCGDTYTDGTVPAWGHSYIHTVQAPTCTEEGYTLHECCMCDASCRDTAVAAKGHTWGDWVTVTAATEDRTGSAKRRCDACGDCETKTLERLPHTHRYETVIAYTAPTCKTEGYATRACSCGDTQTQTLSGDHDWVCMHTDEVGHYDARIMCHCGWSCPVEANYISLFAAHVSSLPSEERYDGHSYFESIRWVVDVPARNWEECSACGAVK